MGSVKHASSTRVILPLGGQRLVLGGQKLIDITVVWASKGPSYIKFRCLLKFHGCGIEERQFGGKMSKKAP